MRRGILAVSLVLAVTVAGCHHGSSVASAPRVVALSPAQLDTLWTSAKALAAKKDWTKATIAIERFMLELPFGDRRIPEARMLLAESYLGEKSNLMAVREFRRVADEYPTDSLAPWALLRAADAYAVLWRNPELDPTDALSAQTVYTEVNTRYPNSPASARATAALAALDEKFAAKSYRTALYYLKYKAYDSAISYLKNVLANWPKTTIVPDVLTKLVETFRRLEYLEDVQEVCAYYRREWPAAPKLNSTCPLPESKPVP